jgi:aquaporin Z
VTLAVLLSRGMTGLEAAYYWAAQFAGGIAGAAVLKLLTSGFGDVSDQTGALGANDYGESISAGGAFLLEALLTFAFVAVILLVTGREAAPGVAGLAIGLALTAVHLVGIPLTGTSVNPARSLGPALFAGGEPLAHVWLFLIAPLVGAALAFAVVRFVSGPFAAAGEAASASDRTDVEVSGSRARGASANRSRPPAKNTGKRRGRS